ncbi:MAG: DUF554 domain-containing protein [Planctomycetaceae bacterium]|nr:DUF554 domain-containing protein [Planctomycetaceae bacterium]
MSISIIGALINATAIIVGSIIGLLLKGRIPGNFAENIIRAIGLCSCIIGIATAIQGDLILVIVSIVLGTAIGELLHIDGGLNKLGQWLQKKLSRKEEKSSFAEGFVTATLLFCVGAMAIVGSIESGLGNSRNTIFIKSILDGVTSMMLASSFGLGVLFSAISVLFYQGSIESFAGSLQGVLTDALVDQISAVGGVMILGIGFNLALNTKIKIANLLPGFVVAVGYYYLFLA